MSKELEALKKIRRLLIKDYQYLADVIEKALTEQEKKDELLELYRECYDEGYFWLEIQQRIKVLEDEMK